MKTHKVDQRRYVHGGIRFPMCYAGAPLLDMDKARLPTSGCWWDVTCKHCLRIGLREGRKVGGK